MATGGIEGRACCDKIRLTAVRKGLTHTEVLVRLSHKKLQW